MGLSRVIVKAPVLTGDDAPSKIGTKHASLSCDPQRLSKSTKPNWKLVICKCIGNCDTKHCLCKKARQNCAMFCHD